jgi:hypothetical protein
MRDTDKGGTGGPVIFAAIGLIILLPVSYVLSVGPVVWLANHDYISKEGSHYVPLQWACDHCQPLNTAVDWYISLFL